MVRALKYAILGLLSQQSRSGYDLSQALSGALQEFWSANHSQIYPELKRLTEEGLAVTDAGELEAEKEITWIFMLREQPCIGHGKAAAGRFVLEYPEDCDAEAEEIRVEDTRMARNWPGSLWRLKIRCPKAKTFRGEFTLRAAAPEEKGKHGA